MFDYQSVKVIGITQPTNNIAKTAEDLVCHCARVSTDPGKVDVNNNPRLIKYLIKNAHWSPFEMVNLIVEVNTTRDISRQIIRHAYRVQEFSQRYSEVTNEFVIREARLQDNKNRQNSFQTDDDDLKAWWTYAQSEVIDLAKAKYEEALVKGIAKEQARSILPEGNTPTKLFLNGNLRLFIHYADVRRGNGTQLEHIDVANKIWDATKEYFPIITNAVEELRLNV